MNQQYQADLVDMQAYETTNDGYKYILTVIDIFSKRAWAKPLKSKTAQHVKPAFESIFNTGHVPLLVQTDEGLEFESRPMKTFFAKYGIKQFSVKSQFKGAIVERFNRTLKTKMWRYFTYKNTRRWVDVLQSLIDAYNNSYNRSIKMTPNEVNKENEMSLWRSKQPLEFEVTTRKVRVGDWVRLSKVKGVFEKGYLPNWTEEIFRVTSVSRTTPVQVKVEDYDGNPIIGSYYLPEVLPVDKPEEFRIEEVLKQRRRAGKTEYFVKWLGYPKQFNSWVTEDQVRRL
jgi:hypothetical protein